MDSIRNNVSFQARLDVSKLTQDKQRWVKIAKEFEQQTKHLPNETLELLPGKFGEIFYVRTQKGKHVRSRDVSFMYSDFVKSLKQLKDSEIAGKLKKLFNLQVRVDELNKDADNFYAKYLNKSNVADVTLNEFFSMFGEAQDAMIARHLKRDTFLRQNHNNLEIY